MRGFFCFKKVNRVKEKDRCTKRALDAIRHLLQSVDLPISLRELDVTDKTKISRWAVEAHKEQRLLSRSPRILSVKDIQKIYERALLRGVRDMV